MGKKYIIIFISLILVAVIAICGTGWYSAEQNLETSNRALLQEANRCKQSRDLIIELRKEKDQLRSDLEKVKVSLNQGTIIGYAYVDAYNIGALDYTDQLATGLKVRLYQVVERTPATTKTRVVAETTVDSRGKFQFRVLPGEYWAEPLLVIPGYPPWDTAIWLKSPGNIIVEAGEIEIGPIFLVRQSDQKG